MILDFGQFVNLATGAVGILFIMTGNEKLHGKISLVLMCFNLMFNIFFIYLWGIEGAAIATTVTIAGENVAKLVIAKKKLEVISVALCLRVGK